MFGDPHVKPRQVTISRHAGTLVQVENEMFKIVHARRVLVVNTI